MLVVVCPQPVHEETVDGVGDNSPNYLEDVLHRRRTTRIALIVQCLRELAGKTRLPWLLDKCVSMAGVNGDTGEDNRDFLLLIVPRNCYPTGIIVNPAHHNVDVARHINA